MAEEFFTIVNKQGEERMLRNTAAGRRVFEQEYEPNGWKVVEREPDYDPAEDLKKLREQEAEEKRKAKEEEEARRNAANNQDKDK